MIALAALLLAAGMLAQPTRASQPGIVQPEVGRFTYTTLSLENGVAKFRDMCLDPLLDHEAIERAVLASGLGFAPDTSVAAGEWLWTSRYGEVYFRSNSAMVDGRPMQDCSVRFAIDQRLTRLELANRIGGLLAPGRRRVDADLMTIWDLGGSFTDRIEMNGFVPGDSRLIEIRRRHIYAGGPR